MGAQRLTHPDQGGQAGDRAGRHHLAGVLCPAAVSAALPLSTPPAQAAGHNRRPMRQAHAPPPAPPSRCPPTRSRQTPPERHRLKKIRESHRGRLVRLKMLVQQQLQSLQAMMSVPSRTSLCWPTPPPLPLHSWLPADTPPYTTSRLSLHCRSRYLLRPQQHSPFSAQSPCRTRPSRAHRCCTVRGNVGSTAGASESGSQADAPWPARGPHHNALPGALCYPSPWLAIPAHAPPQPPPCGPSRLAHPRRGSNQSRVVTRPRILPRAQPRPDQRLPRKEPARRLLLHAPPVARHPRPPNPCRQTVL